MNPYSDQPGTFKPGEVNAIRFQTPDRQVVEHLRRYGLVKGVSLIAQLRGHLGHKRLMDLKRQGRCPWWKPRRLHQRHESVAAKKQQLIERLDEALAGLEAKERLVAFSDDKAQAQLKQRCSELIWDAIAENKALSWAGFAQWGATHDVLIQSLVSLNGFEFPQATGSRMHTDHQRTGRLESVQYFSRADQCGYDDPHAADGIEGAYESSDSQLPDFLWEPMTVSTQSGRDLLHVLNAYRSSTDRSEAQGEKTPATTEEKPAKGDGNAQLLDPKRYHAHHWFHSSVWGRCLQFAQEHHVLFVAKVASVILVFAFYHWSVLMQWSHSVAVIDAIQSLLGCTHFAALSLAVLITSLTLWFVLRASYYSARYMFIKQGWLTERAQTLPEPHYRLLGARFAVGRYADSTFAISPLHRLWWAIKGFLGWFHRLGMQSPLAMTGFSAIYLSSTVDVSVPFLPGPLHRVNAWWASGLTNPHDWVAGPAAGFTWGKLWLLSCDGLERRERSLISAGWQMLKEHTLDVATFAGGVAFLAQIESGIPIIAENMGHWRAIDHWLITIKPVVVMTDTATHFRTSVLGSGPVMIGDMVQGLCREDGHPRWLDIKALAEHLKRQGVEVDYDQHGVRISLSALKALGLRRRPWHRAQRVARDAWCMSCVTTTTLIAMPFKYVLFPILQVFVSAILSVMLPFVLRVFFPRSNAYRRCMMFEASVMKRYAQCQYQADAYLAHLAQSARFSRFLGFVMGACALWEWLHVTQVWRMGWSFVQAVSLITPSYYATGCVLALTLASLNLLKTYCGFKLKTPKQALLFGAWGVGMSLLAFVHPQSYVAILAAPLLTMLVAVAYKTHQHAMISLSEAHRPFQASPPLAANIASSSAPTRAAVPPSLASPVMTGTRGC